MAKAPKAIDPAQTAIDAVEDALKLDFESPENDLDLDDQSLKSDTDDVPRNKAKLASSAKKSPANDDRRAMGKIIYNLQRRPSSAPLWWAFLVSVIWLAGSAFLGAHYFNISTATLTNPQETLILISQAPAIAWLVATFVPILIFFVTASFMWRAQELRLAAHSMSEVALRLSEPENMAADAVANVSQAVRREVAAMGDGVERVLARAGELEVLVHNEMLSIERSYSDNELRIRGLIDELSNQREAIVSNADRVSTSLNTAKMDLSQDLLSVGEKIAADLEGISGSLQTIGGDVTEKLSITSQEMANELGSAGDGLVSQLQNQSSALMNELKSTSESTTEQLANASNTLSSSLQERSNEITQTLSTTGDQIAASISTQTDGFKESMHSTTAAMMVDLSLRSSEITDNIDNISNKVAETLSTKSDAMASNFKTAGDRMEKLFTNDGAQLAERITTSGDGIAKLIETRSVNLLSDIEESTSKVNEKLNETNEAISTNLNSVGEQIGKALTTRADAMNKQLATSGLELVESIDTKSTNLNKEIDSRLIQIDTVIDQKGSELTNALNDRVASLDDKLNQQHKQIGEILTTSTKDLADTLSSGQNELETALTARLEIVGETFNAQTQNLTDTINTTLTSSTEALEDQAKEVTNKLLDRVDNINISLTGNIDNLTTNMDTLNETLETKATRLNEIVEVDLTSASEKLVSNAEDAHTRIMEISENSNKNFTAAADEAANTFAAKTHEAGQTLIGALSNLTTGIRAEATDTANKIEDTTLRLQDTLKSSTAIAEQSLDQHANDLETMLRARTESLTNLFNKDGAEFLNALDEKSTSVSSNISRVTTSMMESLKVQTDQIVDHLTGQFGDVNTILSRINGTNEDMRNALAAADQNLATIEAGLTNRSVEIRNAVAQVTNQSEEANQNLALEIEKLRELSELTIRDTAALASRFDGQSSALTDAAAMLMTASNNMDTTVEERQRVIENLSQGLVSKSADIEQLMESFSTLMNDTVKQAEDRARMVNYSLSSTAEKASEQIVNQLDELRAGANAQLNEAVHEATNRFASASEEMRKTAQTLQTDLQATRAEIKRGIFDLPEETKESTAAMRRLVSDQVRALNDLSEIVNAQRDRQPETRPQATAAKKKTISAKPIATAAVAETKPVAPAPLPEPAPLPTAAPMPIERTTRTETIKATPTLTQSALETAPPVFAPSERTVEPVRTKPYDIETDANAADNGGWVKDLLRRASNEPDATPAATPEKPTASGQTDRSPEHVIESLYSLSVDIARVLDRDATVELWERYQRGERNVFTRRLRTLEGVQLRDEIRRNYSSSLDFANNVNRYINDFEILILEISRRKDGERQTEAYLNSDVGRLYTILAQATGRFE